MGHSSMDPAFHELRPWNEARLIGAKRALKQQQVWAIRFWLDQERRLRDRALFDFGIDSKLRGCDVVRVRIGDVVSGGGVRDRAVVVQQKTKRPFQFEIMDTARKTMRAWLERRGGTLNDFVFPSRNEALQAIWFAFEIGLPACYTLESTQSELMAIARSDVKVAVSNLMDRNEHFGASKWASLQSAEKVLKAAILLRGARFKFVHELKPLCDQLAGLGVIFDHAHTPTSSARRRSATARSPARANRRWQRIKPRWYWSTRCGTQAQTSSSDWADEDPLGERSI